jgi:titin
VTGTDTLGNGLNGLELKFGVNNTIGGTDPGSGNVISGNPQNGIFLNGETGDTVQGNLIGTDATGTVPLGNGTTGTGNSNVRIVGGGNHLIGGTSPEAKNVISAHRFFGVHIDGSVSNTSGNVVQGNYIGTNITGTMDFGNAEEGVWIEQSSDNVVGGVGAGNLISGNRAT